MPTQDETANVTVEVDETGVEDLFEDIGVEGTVGYGADYAAYVEFPTEYVGTQPPFEPLYEWVQRKWDDLDPGLREAGWEQADSKAEAQRNAAWIVVNAIAENGTDGVFFLNRAFEAAKQAGPQFLQKYAGENDPQAAKKALIDTVDFGFETSQDIVADEASDRGTLLQSGFVQVDQGNQTVHERSGDE